MVVLALTDMMAGVGLGLDNLQKATPIISGFLLGYIAVLPLIGRLADLVNRSRVLLICMTIFIIGSGVTALATDLNTLVAGRVVQGVGGGGLVPATLALVADLWPADRRGLPLGVVGAVQELGSVLGPVIGAMILAIADWRAIFWANVALGVILAVALWAISRHDVGTVKPRPIPVIFAVLAIALWWLALAAPRALATDVTLGLPFVPFGDHTARLMTPIGVAAIVVSLLALALSWSTWWTPLRHADLPGALLLGGALGCLVLTFAASDPETEVVGPLGYALLPVGAVLAALYLWRHRVAEEPLVPRGTVRGRTPWALIVSLLVGVALVAVIVDVPLMARLTLEDGTQIAAAMVLVRFLVAVPVGALAGGWLLRRLGDGAVAGSGLALTAAGLVLMSRWGEGSLEEATSTVILVLVGFGVGLALAPVNNAALADSPQTAHGTASSLVVVARMIGMVVGLALLTGIGLHRYYQAVDALPPDLRTDGQALLDAALLQVHTVFLGAAGAAVVGALIAFALLGVRRRSDAVAHDA